ncbi:dynein regulatory complex subunit 2-like [Gouania willdenowi]|uniref:dynein regulatory complex subunit 2-like n=1 Tax=Gouania willdenowi TaxID=441366 RepID=UPI0010548532|nr:dynein regulatory complex subunit 2-like [Gouania willdenowi]
MPPKKGKKKGKSSEKAQLNAEDEQKKQQEKEEALEKFLLHQIQVEQSYSTTNRPKLGNSLKKTLLQHQNEDRMEELEVQRDSEWHLENLDSVVEKLEQELVALERKKELAQRAHQQHMELLDMNDNIFLVKLQQMWIDCLRDTKRKSTSERKQLLDETQRVQGKVDHLKLSAEQRDKIELDKLYQMNQDMLQLHELKTIPLDERLGRTKTIEEDQNDVNELEERKKIIRAETERLEKAVKVLNKLNEKQCTLMVDAMENELMASISEEKQRCQELLNKMNQTSKSAKERLTRVCVQGNQASKRLQALINKEEKIIRGAEICEKLESKHAGLLSSLSLSPPSEEHKVPKSSLAMKSDHIEGLELLILRISKAKLVLEKEKKETINLRKEKEEM